MCWNQDPGLPTSSLAFLSCKARSDPLGAHSPSLHRAWIPLGQLLRDSGKKLFLLMHQGSCGDEEGKSVKPCASSFTLSASDPPGPSDQQPWAPSLLSLKSWRPGRGVLVSRGRQRAGGDPRVGLGSTVFPTLLLPFFSRALVCLLPTPGSLIPPVFPPPPSPLPSQITDFQIGRAPPGPGNPASHISHSLAV